MRVTVILKGFTDQFYEGFGTSIPGILNTPAKDVFEQFRKEPARFPMKIERGQFRDAVELNQLRREPHTVTMTIEPRKGYKLAVFIFQKVGCA